MWSAIAARARVLPQILVQGDIALGRFGEVESAGFVGARHAVRGSTGGLRSSIARPSAACGGRL